MLREYRIRKLKQYIAGVEAVTDELQVLVHSGSDIPVYYIDKLIKSKQTLAEFREKLAQLDDNPK